MINIYLMSELKFQTLDSLSETEIDELINIYKLQKTLVKMENPSPFTIVFIILLIMVGFYLLYAVTLKPSVTGAWCYRDETAELITIKLCHDPFTGVVTKLGIDNKIMGNTTGNLFVPSDATSIEEYGIWVGNVIQWNNKPSWYRNCGK
jgi:hypothetical protein